MAGKASWVRVACPSRVVVLCALATVLAAWWSAQAVVAQAATPQAPAPTGAARPFASMLDRDLLFGDAEITSPQISLDGRYLGFLKAFKGTRQVWVKPAAAPMAAAKPVTSDPKRNVTSWSWSRDGHVLFIPDMTGEASVNLHVVQPGGAIAPGQDVPAARNLTQVSRGLVILYATPRATPDSVLVGVADRQPGLFDVYRIGIADGSRTLVHKNTENVSAWLFDNAGALRLGVRTTNGGDSQLVALGTGGLRVVLACTAFESCTPLRFHPDDKRVYLTSNRGASDLLRLVLFDPETGGEQTAHVDPAGHVDVGRVTFSQLTGEPAVVSYADERLRSYVSAPSYDADYQALTSQLEGLDVELSSVSADDMVWVATATSDVEPGAIHLFDRRTRKAVLQYRVREQLPRDALAPMRAIRYPSRDGLQIPAYLTVPRGSVPANLPLVVAPHAGPWSRDTWGFNPLAQLLANRGYAVLQPNFRGSVGYGRKFLDAGNGQWGAAMQDDLAWGVSHLVAEGIADAARVGIIGTSYGGYAALAGVAFTPDVYKAAVALAAPSNLLTLLEAIPPAWGPVRAVFLARVGNPATAAGKAALEQQSPLRAAARIRTPLLIVQGAADPRAKRSESDRIVVSLRDRKVPVEYLVAPDEAHGFTRPINSHAAYAAAEAFLAKHLGGRPPATVPPAIAARVNQMAVDPATIVLESFDPLTVTAPVPVAPLVARTARYNATLAANGRTVIVPVTQVITEAPGGWTATETMTSPAGEVVDATTLDKASLTVTSRVLRQGTTVVDLTFANNAATGTMKRGEQARPVKAAVGGPVFGDGAGSQAVLATLPLAEGYTALFRTFNVQKQKPHILRLRVVGAESVTVPAGTFNAWKAEVHSAEGDPGGFTFWVARDTRQVVKITTTIAQGPGGTLTTELLP